MAGFSFNSISLGNGFQWRDLGEFGSYPEEHGQGRGKGGGRETDEEVMAGVVHVSNDRDLECGGGSGQRLGQ